MAKLPRRTGGLLLDISHKTLYYAQNDGVYRIASNGDKRKLISGANEAMKLSDSSKYLAVTTDVNRIQVYDLTEPGNEVLIWNYKHARETLFKDLWFVGDELLYISDSRNMICLNLQSREMNRRCVCHSYIDDGTAVYSYINRFTCDGKYLYLLCKYYTSKPPYLSVVDTLTFEEVQSIDLPVESDYGPIIVNPSKYLCIFSYYGFSPARVYRLENHHVTNDILFEKMLPPTLRAVLSRDYRYITIWADEDHYPGHNAYLLSADDFTVIHKTENGKTFNPDFADGSHYWLLPGRNTGVIVLDDYEHFIELNRIWEIIG